MKDRNIHAMAVMASYANGSGVMPVQPLRKVHSSVQLDLTQVNPMARGSWNKTSVPNVFGYQSVQPGRVVQNERNKEPKKRADVVTPPSTTPEHPVPEVSSPVDEMNDIFDFSEGNEFWLEDGASVKTPILDNPEEQFSDVFSLY